MPKRVLLDKLRRYPSLRVAALFLVACILTYVLEHYLEALTADGQHHPGITQSVFNARGVYQYLVASWPRRLVPRYTVLVEIDPEADPTAVSLHNVCEQRPFLARLITALAEHDPAIIVVDKFFMASRCKSGHAGTAALQNAIATVAGRVPIVIGMRIDDRGPPSTGQGEFAWPIVNGVSFPDAAKLTEAVINIDVDSRRLALGWRIQRDGQPEPEWRSALALQAAQVYDSKLLTKYPALQQLIANAQHPYLSVIPRAGFTSYLAGDILCASPKVLSAGAHEGCVGYKSRTNDLEYLRGRIAIVGEVNPDVDVHFAVIGQVPGFVLQANYIEALLDERYFKPVYHWVDYLIGFLFFVAIEAALHQRSALRSLGYLIAVIGVTFLLLFLTVRHLGYYVNPVTVSALVLGVKLVVWLFQRILEKGEARHEA
jgi:CHASE2 domain-containing sensor protein